MKVQLKVSPRIKFVFLLLSLSWASQSLAQDLKKDVVKVDSFDKFHQECDSLLALAPVVNHHGYEIRYVQVVGIFDQHKMTSGLIAINADSIFRTVVTKPSVVGELLNENPKVVDSLVLRSFKGKITKKDSKWIKKLLHFDGFYSQRFISADEIRYPKNFVRCLVIYKESKAFFGFVAYGLPEIDVERIGGEECRALEECINFCFR